MPDKDMELKLVGIQQTITHHYQQGNFVKALDVSKDLLRQTQDHFGQDHPATASAFNNVGLMFKLLGDFTDARKHYNSALRIYGKVVGRDHASYAMALHNLGTLNKAQVHFDSSLKAIERLGLVETALEYLEEAWEIRKAELGDEHPHTVATRSTYGTTLAIQVLHQHKMVERGDHRQYVALLDPQTVSAQGWHAAEQHLREALKTAVSNPRGKKMTISTKNEKKPSPRKKTTTSTSNNTEIKSTTTSKDSPDSATLPIQTLSAAAAAQNLAVFLKSRALTEDPPNANLLEEAFRLYQQVQDVRLQLLPLRHPDVYATKYSLAELMDVMGDKDGANALRQDIIDTYDPPSTSSLDVANQQGIETCSLLI